MGTVSLHNPAMLVLLLCIFLSPGCLSVDPPILTLPSGKVQGHYPTSRAGDPFLAYEGIPYGLPPVDTLRWLPAFPANPWEGVRNCSETPPMCIQSGYYTMWDPDVVFGQEDCLYLNVYTKSQGEEVGSVPSLPVMVFVHGGGLYFGDGGRATYGPEFLMDQILVLVTLNY